MDRTALFALAFGVLVVSGAYLTGLGSVATLTDSANVTGNFSTAGDFGSSVTVVDAAGNEAAGQGGGTDQGCGPPQDTAGNAPDGAETAGNAADNAGNAPDGAGNAPADSAGNAPADSAGNAPAGGTGLTGCGGGGGNDGTDGGRYVAAPARQLPVGGAA